MGDEKIMQNFKSIWACAVEKMRDSFNDTAFDLWISTIEPLKYEDDCAILRVESDFQKSIIMSKYRDIIRQALFDTVGFDMDIKVVASEDGSKEHSFSKKTSEPDLEDDMMQMDFPEYTFENFIVGDSNKHAYASCLAVAKNPAKAYNPLFIYGNTGLGKTHLLFAIKNEIQKNFPSYKTLYVKSEDFTNELIELTRQGKSMAAKPEGEARNMADFKNKYRNVDVLLMDDIQFIAGKEQTQNEFFHTFDALYMNHKQIILVSDRPPKDIQFLDKRLCSRFESGLTTDICMPEYELKVAFIKQKAMLYNIKISEEISDYIAQRVKNNIRQLEGVMKKLMAFQQISNLPPNIAIAQEAIKDITNENEPLPVIVDKVIMEVASEYEVSAEDIKSRRRNSSNIVFARHIAMYILKEITPMSLQEIGKQFSGKDHSTIHYAVKKIEEKVEIDHVLRAKIDNIIKKVRSY